MPKIFIGGLCAVVLFFAGKWLFSFHGQAKQARADKPVIEEKQQFSAVHPMKAQQYDARHKVEEDDVLSDVFAGHEVPFQEIVGLQETESELFQFRNVQVGKTVHFSFYPENGDLRLKEVAYQPDATRIIKANQTSSGWIIDEEPIVYDTREVSKSGTVDQSLYKSALSQDLPEPVILGFADAFAWDIDFAIQTRNGDQYKVVYEEKYLDGKLVTTGRVLAAEYINNGNSFQAYYFEKGEVKGYFDKDGNAMRKAFLKAPVNYRYVTSGFTSARFHPIIGEVMAHNGVDYAAPHGSPVIAVADGIVSDYGWMGAYGNRIEISHGGKYGSQYAHLSGFAEGLSAGQTVKQGEVIGYVGSTGYSTGNHVHYSMTDRGSYVDPSSIDIPEGDPVPERHRSAFEDLVKERRAELESL